MANRKVTPLKDEPGTSLEDIQVELSNCIQAINTLSGKIDTLAKPTANDTSSLRDAVGKAAANEVRLLLEARQRKFKEEEEAAKARGEMSQQEYFQTLTDRYDEVLAKCSGLVDFHKKYWPGLVDKCKDTVKKVGEQSRKNSESLTKIADFIDRVTGTRKPKCVPPPLPKSKAEFIPFLKRYLLYVVKRLCHSRHVHKFIRICMCALWTVFLCALCIIANDNARLRTIEEKYILLRDFSRLDDRTSQRADYIEWLYSDEDEHRQEIDELWQMRKQRLNNNKKQK
ncbi:MAG: hypothetical protein Q4E63_09720 [Prevotellaceae bacterium]|nr:hypothetical protein [Prevotellaceae bacterium]MDO4932899.1 hypothetical protein [Prevotellaceae bacterium]